MKLFAFLLAGSVAGNVALLAAFVSRPSLAPPAVRSLFVREPAPAPAEARPVRTAPPASRADTARAFWARFRNAPLADLVGWLRDAGYPPAVIRAIADAEINERFRPRIEEIRRELNETPYWRGDPSHFTGTADLVERMNQLSRERARALRELLGADALAFAGTDPTEAQRQRFGNLPAGKIEMVQRITDDYADITAQIRTSMQGIVLPEDRAKFELLEREKRADLAAILTPGELAEHEMRTSPITMRLRTAFTIMDATADEFRQIYAAYEAHRDTLFPPSTGGVIFLRTETEDPRRAANEQIAAQLQQTLGAERYAHYQRANDRDFQQLYQLTRSAAVPYETLVRAHDTRQTAAAASMQIFNDPTLGTDQKRDALKALADRTRTQLLSTLGPGAGPAYTDSSRWLTGLAQGRAFTVSADGNVQTRIPMPTRPPLSSPTKG